MPRPFTRRAPLEEPRDEQTPFAARRGHAFGMLGVIFATGSDKDSEGAAPLPAPPCRGCFVLVNAVGVGEGGAELPAKARCCGSMLCLPGKGQPSKFGLLMGCNEPQQQKVGDGFSVSSTCSLSSLRAQPPGLTNLPSPLPKDPPRPLAASPCLFALQACLMDNFSLK